MGVRGGQDTAQDVALHRLRKLIQLVHPGLLLLLLLLLLLRPCRHQTAALCWFCMVFLHFFWEVAPLVTDLFMACTQDEETGCPRYLATRNLHLCYL